MLARCMPIVLAKIIALSINREKTNNEIYGPIYVARSTAENDNATTRRVCSLKKIDERNVLCTVQIDGIYESTRYSDD